MTTLKPGGNKTHSELMKLRSMGPAMARDFGRLGVQTLSQLARSDAKILYKNLCRPTSQRQDPCVLDTFTPPCPAPFRQGRICGVVPPSAKGSWEGRHNCAIEQAKNPNLPSVKKNWWYWNRVRKSNQGRLRIRA